MSTDQIEANVMPGAEAWSAPGHGEHARTGVVVSHGFSGNPSSVRALAETIAAKGYAVEVPRLPGHGTRWQDMARTRYPQWRAEVERVTADLGTRCDRVFLVGLSMGGSICLDVASSNDAVTGVVAINAQLLTRTDPISRALPVLQYLLPVAPAAVAGIKGDVAKEGAEESAYSMIPAKAGYSFSSYLPTLRERVASLTIPIVAIYSALDQTVPNANTKALPGLAPKADVELIELPRSMHVATLDYDVEMIEAAVFALLER